MLLAAAETGTVGLTVLHPETYQDRNAYVVDLIVSIKTNTKIDLTAIYHLMEKIGECCHIASFTTDQYQSTHMRQQAQLDGLADDIGLQSVVKTTEPYETASRIVQNRQLYTGTCTKLKRQLGNVQITEGGKVYQSTTEGEHGDVGDSLAGALFRCVMDLDKSVRYRVEDWWNRPELEPWKVVEKSMEGFNSL